MSAADLMAVLLARHLRYDWQRPDDPANDHLIFSKGHASPLLYSMFKAAGVVSDDELMHRVPAVRLAAGGPPHPGAAVGGRRHRLARPGAARRGRASRWPAGILDELPYRVWVLCGDSEMAEGSMWEALDKAAYYRLDNLTAIVDVNRLGQRGPTELGWDLDAYASGLRRSAAAPSSSTGTTWARSTRRSPAGAGAGRPDRDPGPDPSRAAGSPRSRTARAGTARPLPAEMAERAIVELGGRTRPGRSAGRVPEGGSPRACPSGEVSLPRYELGAKVATRKAFGEALAAVGARGEVVALDGEVGNSTHTEEFAKAHPERYFEMFIAEQQLVAAAVGLSVRGYVPFAATFAAFFTRAYDFIRMAAISAGQHPAVRLPRRGRDRRGRPVADGPRGPGHDAGRARLHGPVPQRRDQHGATWCRRWPTRDGVVYMRTTRGAYPVLYRPDEAFPVGGAKVVRSSPEDQVTLIGAGVTLHNCLAAADQLAADGIRARVLDLYSVKPIDTQTLLEAAAATGGRAGRRRGPLPGGRPRQRGARRVQRRGPPGPDHPPGGPRTCPARAPPPNSWTPAGISAAHIAQAARDLLSG